MPAWANLMAVAAPMPRDAPVTIATLPSRLIIFVASCSVQPIASPFAATQLSTALLRSREHRVVVRVIGDIAHILGVSDLVIRANHKHRSREHPIERAPL